MNGNNNNNLNVLIGDLNATSFMNESTAYEYVNKYKFTPNAFEWCLLVFATSIFFIGIIGNLLVVIVVVINSHMRTITNIFIVNLAIGDFFVILICLPPSIITDIAGNWWFGSAMCKIIPFVQYISVCVSVMTLTSISYERYYAIVYPLKFQATKFRTKIIIFVIWTLAILINLPHPIVIKMHKDNASVYCYPTWNKIFQNILDMLIFVILYILPMALIFYTYTRVVKVLWKIDKSIAWDQEDAAAAAHGAANTRRTPMSTTYTFQKKHSTNATNSSTSIPLMNKKSNSTGSMYGYTVASGSSAAKSKMKNQLIARRKAAKMLITVAFMFAICYLPIHVLNILRFTASNFLENIFGDYVVIIFQIAHCLVYVNSSINPLIYNFMSDNFRKEFRKILFCNRLGKDKSTLDHDSNGVRIRYLNGMTNSTNINTHNGQQNYLPHQNGRYQNVNKNNLKTSSNYTLY